MASGADSRLGPTLGGNGLCVILAVACFIQRRLAIVGRVVGLGLGRLRLAHLARDSFVGTRWILFVNVSLLVWGGLPLILYFVLHISHDTLIFLFY